jgi:hypothetical protein
MGGWLVSSDGFWHFLINKESRQIIHMNEKKYQIIKCDRRINWKTVKKYCEAY